MRRLGQGVFDLFCRDMDASMREMGVGDLTVPRKMRRIGAAFYERQAGLSGRPRGRRRWLRWWRRLRATCSTRLSPSDRAGRLARYVRAAERDAGRAGCRGVRAPRASFPRSRDGREPRRGMTAMARAHGNSDSPEPDRKGTGPLWSVPLAISDVPETGRQVDLIADAAVRAAIAKLAGLRDLPRLEATFDVTLHGHGGLRVTGHVRATVGQDCVVTLEPVENEIDEPVDLVFAPPEAAAAGGGDSTETSDDDAPEPLVGGIIDLGRDRDGIPAAGDRPLSAQAGCGVRGSAGGNRHRPSVCCPRGAEKGPRRQRGRVTNCPLLRPPPRRYCRFMSHKVRIALDAMGGDHGASVIVPGAELSLSRHPDTEFLLFGDQSCGRPAA